MHAGKGLTLTELMVVVLIVSVLAGVSLPIMQRRIDEAKWAEGKMIMGTIAKALRAHIAEKGSAFSHVPTLAELGFWEGDLDGTFFKGGESGVGNFSWVINSSNPVDFLITATAPDEVGSPAMFTLDNTGTYKEGLVNQTGKSVGENSGNTSESAAGGSSTYLPGKEAEDSTNPFGTRPSGSAQTYYDPNSLGLTGGNASGPNLK